ncbi:phosphatase PAP2 family protein [Pseudoteredinibacter isoporae]|uniref:undecaprenyl-diphosphate phosphatase n=1 Tax=Pseudoteredinibacter isoporae TaxID=570281 RepID=A0A7X0JTH9_9GAMM|nr:phosphatase PAP2 family protein [Pseudoteredinibacter isoporae]MBB6521949.1 undecaprenyl-diphosphatase [Pseudoteredinibacter isoporae]NHO87485.1 phosphatase PAP2 family protein [Pseudoteredinibacter isoporae]NIB24184.1 phosphatase PAP2 family protein [Pseudoteredinibacter isoporae]
MASPISAGQQILASIHQFDVAAFYWCLRRKHRQLLIQGSYWVSKSADGPLYALFGLALLVQGLNQFFLLLATGFIAERSLYYLLKNYFKRNRPPAALPDFQSVVQPSDQFSFPSGHTSAAFLMAAMLSSFYPVLAPILYVWAVMVGSSRVMLGVHFPTDIVAGASLGHGIAFLILSY